MKKRRLIKEIKTSSLANKTTKELQTECRILKVPTSGAKPELRDRIRKARSGQTTINFTPGKRPRPETQGEGDEDAAGTPKKRLREGGKLHRSPEAGADRRVELKPAINRKGEHSAKRARGINVSKEDNELQESPRGGGELDLE